MSIVGFLCTIVGLVLAGTGGVVAVFDTEHPRRAALYGAVAILFLLASLAFVFAGLTTPSVRL